MEEQERSKSPDAGNPTAVDQMALYCTVVLLITSSQIMLDASRHMEPLLLWICFSFLSSFVVSKIKTVQVYAFLQHWSMKSFGPFTQRDHMFVLLLMEPFTHGCVTKSGHATRFFIAR